MSRPDLSTSPHRVQVYVEHLERQVAILKGLAAPPPTPAVVKSAAASVHRANEVRRWLREGLVLEAREGAGLSQSEVARAIGVNPATFARWEQGNRNPKNEAAVRLGVFLDALGTLPGGPR